VKMNSERESGKGINDKMKDKNTKKYDIRVKSIISTVSNT